MRTHTIRRKKRFRNFVTVVVVVCAVATGAYFGFFRSKPVLNPHVAGPVKYLIYGREPVAFDQKGEPKLVETDLMITATLDRSGRKIDILFFPPNTLLTDGEELRNIYGSLGVAGLKATVEKITKDPIDYYIGVDYNAFVQLVNKLNGIEVTVGEPLNLPKYGLILDAGINSVDGESALKLLRLKSSVDDSKRLLRQESVFRGIYKRLTEINRLAKLKDVTDAVLEVRTNLETDIQSEQILEGFNFFRKGVEELNINTLPGQLLDDKWVPVN